MNKQPKIILVLPRSFGDVLQATAICKRIKEKYPNCDLSYGVEPQYKEILEGCPSIDHILSYDQRMDNPEFLQQYYDIVYTPHLYTQYIWSTVNQKKYTEKNLIQHFCWHANVSIEKFDRKEFYVVGKEFTGIEFKEDKKYIVFCTNSSHKMESKRYSFWNDVIINLNLVLPPEYVFIQVGAIEDELLNIKECNRIIDLRGKTTIQELNYVVKKSSLVLTVDSYLSHLAYILDIPVVSLYGSTGFMLSGLNYIEGSNQNVSCIQADPSCLAYKNECRHWDKCIDNIDPVNIHQAVMQLLEQTDKTVGKYQTELGALGLSFVKHYPTIGGYTTIFNGIENDFPFIESIRSALEFCDTVTVIDGESTDGTYEKLQEEFGDDSRVQIYQKLFDMENEPGCDGSQKAFARALADGEFLIQFDADEVFHEDDNQKWKELVRRFPANVDVMNMPVIDYFDGEQISNDFHAWKWRVTRNKPHITHCIPKPLQIKDEKTGKIYAKRGTDGCDICDIVSEMPLPSTMYKDFYTQELDDLRKDDPEEYGRRINQIFNELPSVHHFSWFKLDRKVKHMINTWDKLWSNLYNDPEPVRRFETDDVKREVELLRKNGGCHGTNGTTIKVEKSLPKIINEWINK